jgi:putative CocE/NonD family hydrolase
MKKILKLLLIWSVMPLFVSLSAQEIPKKRVYKKHLPTDQAAGSLKPYDKEKNKQYKGMKIKTLYLTMRDSVQIAVDLYLPKGLKEGEKIPTIVRQTRYWRRPQLRFPFSVFSNGLLGRTGKMVETFVENGYAIVNVDTRGSGASFGSRQHPWTEDEVKDGEEILDWIVAQPWSNGNVGSMGVSYGGTTAEFLATNHHPSLKAVVLMFSLFDIYEDNAFPGGIHNEWFTSNWGNANERMDRNKLPAHVKGVSWLIKGVVPVKGKKRKKTFKRALKDHEENRNVHDGAVAIDYRDEVPFSGAERSVELFSPHNFVDQLDGSGVAVYSYSGWHDGAYQNAAIKRHLNLSNPQNKLMLGPWEHGGAFNISPYTRSKAGFDHAAELLKFFDYHLKGIENGLYEEPAVHYFTVGAEKWQSAASWPPESIAQSYYLGGNQQLLKAPESEEGSDLREEDNRFGTGPYSRWTAVNGRIKNPYTYPDWTARSQGLLHYETEVLEDALEISGHPKAKIYASMNSCDGAVFVYLEEVTASGAVYQVTEGQLKATHRKKGEYGLYCEAGPPLLHTLDQEAEVKPKEVMELEFDLLPISWEFQKGSKIRISIAGGDSYIFEEINPDGYELKVHYGGEYPTVVELPVVER